MASRRTPAGPGHPSLIPDPFVSPPTRLPFPWGWLLRRVERRLGRPLVANRILGWSPRTLLGTGLLEALVVHDDEELGRRLLRLVRLAVSFQVSCPFCIDLNGHGHGDDGVTDDEVRRLARGDWGPPFSDAERAALDYVVAMTATPVRLSEALVAEVKSHLSDRAFTVLAATAAQVNLWARLFQGLGVNEAGFSPDPTLYELDRFRTRVP